MSTPIPVSLEQVRSFRLVRSGLLQPFDSPAAAARALAGIQAQILPAAGVALWNRTRGLTQARFEQLLFSERTLVKLWGQRGTLHLYPSADWPLVCGMMAGARSWWARTAEKEGRVEDYEQLIAAVAAELRRKSALGQTMGRSDLRAALADVPAVDLAVEPAEVAALDTDQPGAGAGVSDTRSPAHPLTPPIPGLSDDHLSPWGGIFADLVRRGYACHANREGEGRFVAREAWLPDLAWEPPDYDTANVLALRRYIRAYGPTTCEDFRYWRLAYAAPARHWWSAVEQELVPVAVAGGQPATQYIFADDVEALTAPVEPSAWPLHMLYRFDPLLLGHRDKSWIVPPAHYSRVWRPAGHIEGVLLVQGIAVGAWRYLRKGSKLHIVVQPFSKAPKRLQTQVARTAAAVAGFFEAELGGVEWVSG